MEKVLILGVDGFLGFHLSRRFILKYEVHGYVRDKLHLKRPKHPEIIYHDSKEDLSSIIKKNRPEFIINSITKFKFEKEEDFFTSNLILPIKAFRTSCMCDVKIYINTDSFFNNPNNISSYLKEYTLSKKHLLEWFNLFKSKQVKFVNMKIFHMYGELDSSEKFVPWLINTFLNNTKEIDLTEGEQLRDFIYVGDVAEAYLKIVESHSQLSITNEFEVGTGDFSTLKSFIQKTKKLINSSTKLNFGALNYRKGELIISKANNKNLVHLGWKPKTSLDSGLLKTIRSMK